MKRIITAESVCAGHPDKLCDLISDGILDACLLMDPDARVACETMATGHDIFVCGEVTCNGKVDYASVAKEVLSRVGYHANQFRVTVLIHDQSPDIAGGVSHKDGQLGAGDQGVMYGFACDETRLYLPAPVVIANLICREIDRARQTKKIDCIKPDGKCLVGVEYEDGIPKRIDSIVISVQHDENVSMSELTYQLKNLLIPKLSDASNGVCIDALTRIMVNPSGRFVLGGPEADTGLTGRKLMCDTYGGIAHHGGGAFSGKDGTKVDRSAAYYARYVAKNIVAAKLAKKCEVCITYAIGEENPVSVEVDTFGTGIYPDEQIADIAVKYFDFTPLGIIEKLNLRAPSFSLTTCYGHFGKEELTYEQIDMAENFVEWGLL